jgi:hypothetical protein|tara:strand:- start:1246 stop:1428 length:183 start_codon:yes stop_codon:yes gene_type:complete
MGAYNSNYMVLGTPDASIQIALCCSWAFEAKVLLHGGAGISLRQGVLAKGNLILAPLPYF